MSGQYSNSFDLVSIIVSIQEVHVPILYEYQSHKQMIVVDNCMAVPDTKALWILRNKEGML